MKLSAMCIRCLIDRQEERTEGMEDENRRSAYLKEVAGVIAASAGDDSAPYLVARINRIYKRYFGKLPSYEKEKAEFNSLMLAMEAEMEGSIRMGEDAEKILKNALNYARAGNYIDFGAANRVEKSCLLELLHSAEKEELDTATFQRLRHDLDKAGELVYLTDNCGEIVADKLLIKIIGEQYPDIHITVIVRGEPVLNDADMEDARQVGLADMVRVIGNGNGVAGTQISMLSNEARYALGAADLIISKGQGNFETIHDCGLNIYYLFLCKCEWFSRRFGLERLKGVFINEQSMG